jgi:hypothetical protein
MKKPILMEGKKYTFSDYFELNNSTEEIVEELGYSFSHAVINLPQSKDYKVDDIKKLQDTFYTILPRITINSEIAKRDFLIAPILVEIVRNTESKINVEYAIEIDSRLSGSLDYLIRLKQELIVIEAKRGDLDRGFNQLSAELIALDKYEENKVSNRLYGAITIGDVWRFGILERKKRHIIKDINSFTIPGDLEKVFSILLGILTT